MKVSIDDLIDSQSFMLSRNHNILKCDLNLSKQKQKKEQNKEKCRVQRVVNFIFNIDYLDGVN